ncbi:MAG: hypothetical protein M1817_004075 [Caeruleum heppii]|nr:MAG: hypothetical protein M1817_004075 [Caeruleum heppii]
MNWTGGNLQRSRWKAGSLTHKQKQYFAKRRMTLQQSPQRRCPPDLSLLRELQAGETQFSSIAEAAGTHIETSHPGETKANTLKEVSHHHRSKRGHLLVADNRHHVRTLTERTVRPSGSERVRTSPQHAPPLTFGEKREQLLNRPDWIGISPSHPPPVTLDVRHSSRLAKRRQVTAKEGERMRGTHQMDRRLLNRVSQHPTAEIMAESKNVPFEIHVGQMPGSGHGQWSSELDAVGGSRTYEDRESYGPETLSVRETETPCPTELKHPKHQHETLAEVLPVSSGYAPSWASNATANVGSANPYLSTDELLSLSSDFEDRNRKLILRGGPHRPQACPDSPRWNANVCSTSEVDSASPARLRSDKQETTPSVTSTSGLESRASSVTSGSKEGAEILPIESVRSTAVEGPTQDDSATSSPTTNRAWKRWVTNKPHVLTETSDTPSETVQSPPRLVTTVAPSRLKQKQRNPDHAESLTVKQMGCPSGCRADDAAYRTDPFVTVNRFPPQRISSTERDEARRGDEQWMRFVFGEGSDKLFDDSSSTRNEEKVKTVQATGVEHGITSSIMVQPGTSPTALGTCPVRKETSSLASSIES